MQLSEEQHHAVEHARYLCKWATDDDPAVCFDYTLVQTLVELIDRLIQQLKEPT